VVEEVAELPEAQGRVEIRKSKMSSENRTIEKIIKAWQSIPKTKTYKYQKVNKIKNMTQIFEMEYDDRKIDLFKDGEYKGSYWVRDRKGKKTELKKFIKELQFYGYQKGGNK